MRQALEDTQLAFYAALQADEQDRVPPGLSAAYLALDERDGPVEIPHPGVVEHAAVLVAALGDELARARGGEGLRALGRGEACSFCPMRGLCRKDHWAAPPDEAATEGAPA